MIRRNIKIHTRSIHKKMIFLFWQ